MSPYEVLKSFILTYVDENKLDDNLKKEVPKKWEKYGDFVLFDDRVFCSDVWRIQNISFWNNVASILKCKRIGIKSKIKKDNFRSPNVSILLGNDPWVVHKENSILYTWNVLENMFSAGNVNEKQRLAKLNCQNEIIVDLFAGIGYFTLPFLVHAKASFVHACEWNPIACEALEKNLKLNKVFEKCKIYQGDNRLLCPKRVANRVNLGLLPSSENYWGIACNALVDEGGILHIHENVEVINSEICCHHCIHLSSQININNCNKNLQLTNYEFLVCEGNINVDWKHKKWLLKALHILHSICSFLSTIKSGTKFCTSIQNLNFVKSYAPKIHHLVYDVKVVNINNIHHIKN